MGAQFLKFGDPPPTGGGDFERTVMQCLCDGLPDIFMVIGNLSFARPGGSFYESDIIVTTVDLCEVVEAKFFFAEARVFEDCITGINDFSLDQVFSTLENKTRIFRNKLLDGNKRSHRAKVGAPMLSYNADVWVDSRIVLPNRTNIVFEFPDHERNHKVLTVDQLIDHYRRMSFPVQAPTFQTELQRLRNGWKAYLAQATPSVNKQGHLGRFVIRKVLRTEPSGREYLAMDEAPCKMDVHLKEFKYNPLLSREDLENHLATVSREMQTLRRIRHPYIACVTGHFQTGMSLVQVSDWFDGRSIEESWSVVETLSFDDKLALMIRITQAIAFCHQKGVFHRNIHAGNVQISEACDDIRVRGFEFAKDLDLSGTVAEDAMERREKRIIPPEELSHSETNPRLYDVYQTGMLFYRLVENGEWALDDVMEYCTGNGKPRLMVNHADEAGITKVTELINSMVEVEPTRRPDPMSRVEGVLKGIVAERTQAGHLTTND